jgi:hypothetical protein
VDSGETIVTIPAGGEAGLGEAEETEDNGGEAEYFFHDLLLEAISEALLYEGKRREIKDFRSRFFQGDRTAFRSRNSFSTGAVSWGKRDLGFGALKIKINKHRQTGRPEGS